MNTAEKTLLVLTSCSLRANFIQKAQLYAECGLKLFPDSTELREFFGLTLLHAREFDNLQYLLEDTDLNTRNLAYLRLRLAIFGREANQVDLARAYLNMAKR